MKSLKLIVYDFDGVMTDNKVYMDQGGQEMVYVNRAYGLGVSMIKKLEIEQVIISTKINLVVYARAKKLNIFCFQGIENKTFAFKQFCIQNKFDMKHVGYVSNDINDL